MVINAEELYEQGIAMTEEGWFSEAIEYFTQAIQLDVNYLEAYYNRAYVYFQLKGYKQFSKNCILNYSKNYFEEFSG